ncbi:MAG TPA: hypothetical protein VFJ64_00270 [Solirubrobacterales bacterium]|nr:hypothetical protein [Solirubrobacterales bacterium]
MTSLVSSHPLRSAVASSWSPARIRLVLLALVAAAFFLVPAAQAAAAEHSLEVQFGGGGEGAVGCKVEAGPLEECEAEYAEGTNVTVVAEPELGSEFVEWNGECDTVVGGECEVEMNADKTVEVVFDLEEFELTVETEGTGEGIVECQIEGGSYEPCPEAETYPYGTEVILYAESEEGSEFVEWGGDCSGVEIECELTVEEPLGVTATFMSEPPFALTIETGGTGAGEFECEVEGEAAEPCDPEAEYEEGTVVVVIAEPNPGSEFVAWSGECDTIVGNECEVEMNADKTVKATFNLKATPKFALKVKKTGSGTGKVESTSPVSPKISCGSECEKEFNEGTVVTLTQSAEAGSEFIEWTGACTGSGTCEVTMSAAKEVTAKFNLKATPKFKLTITKAGTGSGTVTCNGGACAAEYPEGEEVTLAATAASGSTFSGWSGGGCSGTAPCTVTIEEDTTVTATFTANSKEETKKEETKKEEPKPTPEGTAKAAASATVKSGKAELKLTCSGGPCKGTLQLKAKVKQGKKTKNLVIGKASFSLAEGATATVKVKLSGPAKQELAKGKTIKAKLTGTGITASTVKLKPAKKK